MLKKQKIRELIKENQALLIVLLVYTGLVCIPLLNQGVMCNDEVQHRFQSFQGIKNFFRTFVTSQAFEKGRSLAAIPSTIFLYLGFASSNRMYERVVAVISILLCIGLLSYFWKKLFDSKFLALLYGILTISFIPISFEHGAPNAFVTVYCFPAALMILSWIYYLDFLKNNSKKKLTISIIFLFISLTSYEIFVTYIPVFLFIAFYKSDATVFGSRLKDAIKKFTMPLLCGILFLALYVILGKIFVSSYDGNQIGNCTLVGIMEIIGHLFLASIPGYLLFNSKYEYLFSLYAPKDGAAIGELFLKNLDMRIIGLVIFAIIIFVKLYNMKHENENNKKIITNIGIMSVAVLYMILPSLPNAVSSMYQGHVNANEFVQLPVTLFSYFSCCFIISYLISWIRYTGEKKIQYVLVPVYVILGVIFVGVQEMNTAFAEQQKEDFERMTQIEDLFDTETMAKFNNKIIYAPDIYQTKNVLAFQDGYWTQYASKNNNIVLIEQNPDKKEEAEYTLNYIDDMYFTLQNNDNLLVVLNNNDRRKKAYVNFDNFSLELDLDTQKMLRDKKCKIFYFRLQNGQIISENVDQFYP